MIKGLYFVLEEPGNAVPFKRGDTLQVLWESDRCTWHGPNNQYFMLVVSNDGDTLPEERGPKHEAIAEHWGTFVKFMDQADHEGRDYLIRQLAAYGVISEETAALIVGKSNQAILDPLYDKHGPPPMGSYDRVDPTA